MPICRVFPIQRKAAVWALAVLVVCPLASAQGFLKAPTVDVFAGYSYMRFDSKPLGFSDQLNLNGWNFEIAIPYIYQGLGAVVDVSANYGHELSAYNFSIGPQYTLDVKNFRLFGHLMYGKSRERLGIPGSSQLEPSNLARNISAGAGIDIPVGAKVSWRALQGDYMFASNFGGGQRDVRLSTGLVIRFGKH